MVNGILEECEVFIGEHVDLIVDNIMESHRDHNLDELVVDIVGHQMISLVEPFYILETEGAKTLIE